MKPSIARVIPSALCLALLWSAVTTTGAPSGSDQQAPAPKRPLTLETMGGGGGGGGFGGGGVSISPDGKWLAIGGQGGLRLVPVDGSAEPRPWFQGTITAWFPDGQKVLTSRQGDLWSVPINSTTATQITKDEANERAPAISPDGKWIAFSSTRGGQNDVWIVAADGSAPPRQLTQAAMPEDETRFGPVWSPDSKTIFYSTDRTIRLRIYRRPLTGAGQEEALTPPAGWAVAWDVSPDGRFLVYEQSASTALTNMDLWILPLSGGGEATSFLATRGSIAARCTSRPSRPARENGRSRTTADRARVGGGMGASSSMWRRIAGSIPSKSAPARCSRRKRRSSSLRHKCSSTPRPATT